MGKLGGAVSISFGCRGDIDAAISPTFRPALLINPLFLLSLLPSLPPSLFPSSLPSLLPFFPSSRFLSCNHVSSTLYVTYLMFAFPFSIAASHQLTRELSCKKKTKIKVPQQKNVFFFDSLNDQITIHC